MREEMRNVEIKGIKGDKIHDIEEQNQSHSQEIEWDEVFQVMFVHLVLDHIYLQQ